MLFSLDKVSFSYGDNLIFKDVTFSLNEGERAGLIGANGEGKTTLIKLILGEYEPESGGVIKKNGLKIGYLAQNGGYDSGNTVFDEMKEIFSEQLASLEKLETLSSQLAVTPYPGKEYDVLSSKIESLNRYVRANDCFGVDVKIKTVLNGMGFGKMYGSVIDTMSGGEKTRLKLARLLLENPDLLILDEPTNHLDVATLYWLEEYLQNFKGAIFVVSHDRYFLDRIINRTFEIENKGLTAFSGNYSKYKILKEQLYERKLKEYEAQLEERKKLQDYVDRNIVRATTAKSAQSRVKQLERMEILEKPYLPPKPPVFKFVYDTAPYENVLEIKNFNLVRGTKTLLSGADFSVKRGDKIAVVGENGTGKSSFLKEIILKNPRINFGRNVKIAFYDQETANLNGENTVLNELWERHTGYTQTEARAALARCGLYSEDTEKKVKSLSGGERAKLALCVLECERGNVLLMDEPTNHLDLPAREGLEKALKEFDGTLIFVSHDRYFLTALASKTAEIEDGKLNFYDGGYEFYVSEKKKNSVRAQSLQAEKRCGGNSNYRSNKERAEIERKKRQQKNIECEIDGLEKRESEINSLLADPDVVSDYLRVAELTKELESVREKTEKLYSEYAEFI